MPTKLAKISEDDDGRLVFTLGPVYLLPWYLRAAWYVYSWLVDRKQLPRLRQWMYLQLWLAVADLDEIAYLEELYGARRQ